MALPTVLTQEEIAAAMKNLPNWQNTERELVKRLHFEDFGGAMRFMQACIPDIEQLNHHPVWTNKFNTVEVRLTTFDVGNRITRSDIKLAERIEKVLAEYGGDFDYVPE